LKHQEGLKRSLFVGRHLASHLRLHALRSRVPLKPAFAMNRELQGKVCPKFRGAAASKRRVSTAQTFARNFAAHQFEPVCVDD
jgi:hypothetical protein